LSKQIFKCEKCGLEFEDNYWCINHETECFNEQDTININYKKALDKLNEKYELKITKYYANIYIRDDGGFISKYIQIGLEGSLPNGHIIDDNNPYFSINSNEEIKEDIFYHYIEDKLILPYLDTCYEGELRQRYSDWGNRYIIDNLDIDEICRRFYDKKVRIEIIQ
jgi:hypothetical protein